MASVAMGQPAARAVVLDLDATLVLCHSEKEDAAGTRAYGARSGQWRAEAPAEPGWWSSSVMSSGTAGYPR